MKKRWSLCKSYHIAKEILTYFATVIKGRVWGYFASPQGTISQHIHIGSTVFFMGDM